jgi:hypothetical protein
MPVRHLVMTRVRHGRGFRRGWPLGGRLALPASQRATFAPPWPERCDRMRPQRPLFTRMLRGYSSGHCYTVQILDPRIDPAHWDTVIAPRHDQLSGPNVLQPMGSLNPVDDAWLQRRPRRLPGPGRSATPARRRAARRPTQRRSLSTPLTRSN